MDLWKMAYNSGLTISWTDCKSALITSACWLIILQYASFFFWFFSNSASSRCWSFLSRDISDFSFGHFLHLGPFFNASRWAPWRHDYVIISGHFRFEVDRKWISWGFQNVDFFTDQPPTKSFWISATVFPRKLRKICPR